VLYVLPFSEQNQFLNTIPKLHKLERKVQNIAIMTSWEKNLHSVILI